MTDESADSRENPDKSNESLIADDTYLQQVRQETLRFATLQLGDRIFAEDAVQEALIDAFKNVRSFAGRAAFKTWIFAILKNKIADTIRKKCDQMKLSC